MVIAYSIDDVMPGRVLFVHDSELEDYTPIFEPLRRTSTKHNRIVQKEIDNMLSAGIITQYNSSWVFTVVIVSKKYGELGPVRTLTLLKKRMKEKKWLIPNIKDQWDA